MLIANRINSILSQEKSSVTKIIRDISDMGLFTHVDLNYPEHFDEEGISSIKEALASSNLKINGLAMRFRDNFINGEFGNRNNTVSREAISMTKEAIDVCEYLGGQLLTIWLGYDGFDYPFQVNYTNLWNTIVSAFREIADYNKKIKISIEYKPYQPRSFSMLSSIGTTILAINEINRENLGITLDYCHMLMKGENPAFSLALAAEKSNLFGIHLNDGYGLNDDGLMIGSVSLFQTLEFVYYLKKINYTGIIYFDTFPVREDAWKECEKNIQVLQKLFDIVDALGMDYIENIINKNDAIAVQDLLLKILR